MGLKNTNTSARQEHFRLIEEEWNALFDASRQEISQQYLETVDCPVCQQKKYRALFRKKGLDFCRCAQCEHIFINPQLKQSVLDQHFLHSKAWEVWSKEVLTSEEQIAFDKAKYEKAIVTLENLLPNKTQPSVLDIGCASGVFLSLCKEKSWDCQGVEPSKEASLFAQNHFQLDVFNGPFLKFESKQKFDLISFWASLEYDKNPRLVIEKALSHLKEDGIIYCLISGNSHSLTMRSLQAECVGYIFNRCNSFSPNSLNYLMDSFGLKPIFINSIIPDTKSILNHLAYQEENDKQKLFSEAEEKTLEQFILKNNMGYKFMATFRKK